MSTGSKKIVVVGIVSNALVTIIKFISAFVSLSASMMNEAIHSMMDTLNQVFLLFGFSLHTMRQEQNHLMNLWQDVAHLCSS